MGCIWTEIGDMTVSRAELWVQKRQSTVDGEMGCSRGWMSEVHILSAERSNEDIAVRHVECFEVVDKGERSVRWKSEGRNHGLVSTLSVFEFLRYSWLGVNVIVHCANNLPLAIFSSR